ncbi:MAG: GDSL-type esterase/lipase family protein [Sporolactobacillus sp.]
MKKLKIFLIISIVLNLIFIAGGINVLKNKGGMNYITQKINKLMGKKQPDKFFPYYYDRKDLFSHLKIDNKSIVFLGDSLSDYNEWSEAFNNPNIKNRGIGGDRTAGVLGRLSEVTKGQPKKVFLLIGINDLANKESIQEISSNYEKIINTIKSESPKTQLYVQSILPVNEKKNTALPDVTNGDIVNLNNSIKSIAKTDLVTFINLYPLFEKDGQMNPSLTTDGVHLKSHGYIIWEKAIRKYVEQ